MAALPLAPAAPAADERPRAVEAPLHLTSRRRYRKYAGYFWEVPMHYFANQSSFGARAISGAYLLLVRPAVASPAVSGKRQHKRR